MDLPGSFLDGHVIGERQVDLYPEGAILTLGHNEGVHRRGAKGHGGGDYDGSPLEGAKAILRAS